MKISNKEFNLSSEKQFQVFDITKTVKEHIAEENIHKGLITISTKHTTTAIRVNENEERLLKDLSKYFADIAPDGKPYLHDDVERRDCPNGEPKNTHAHLQAMIMGASESLPIVNGTLSLGEWQGVFFIELDGARERTYTLTIIGE
jgi:secondary thiamine-phosphate synthase enzyme